jgi:hypothetical protein
MIALDTNILARAIAVEMNADAATKPQRKRAQSGLSSGLATFDTRFVKTARRLGLEPAVSAPG